MLKNETLKEMLEAAISADLTEGQLDQLERSNYNHNVVAAIVTGAGKTATEVRVLIEDVESEKARISRVTSPVTNGATIETTEVVRRPKSDSEWGGKLGKIAGMLALLGVIVMTASYCGKLGSIGFGMKNAAAIAASDAQSALEAKKIINEKLAAMDAKLKTMNTKLDNIASAVTYDGAGVAVKVNAHHNWVEQNLTRRTDLADLAQKGEVSSLTTIVKQRTSRRYLTAIVGSQLAKPVTVVVRPASQTPTIVSTSE